MDLSVIPDASFVLACPLDVVIPWVGWLEFVVLPREEGVGTKLPNRAMRVTSSSLMTAWPGFVRGGVGSGGGSLTGNRVGPGGLGGAIGGGAGGCRLDRLFGFRSRFFCEREIFFEGFLVEPTVRRFWRKASLHVGSSISSLQLSSWRLRFSGRSSGGSEVWICSSEAPKSGAVPVALLTFPS